MSRKGPPSLVWGVVLGLAMILMCSAWLTLRQKRAAWVRSCEQIETCKEIASRIQRLKTVPRFAVTSADSPEAISARIGSTVSTLLPPGSLVSIQAEPVRNLGNAPYLLSGTQITLRDVTLPQIARFAGQLEDHNRGLVITELRLSDSDTTGSNDRWSTDLKLTQTIYSANVRGKR